MARPSSAQQALRLLSLTTALLMVSASPAAGITWRVPRLLMESEVEMAIDADFHGQDTAVVLVNLYGPDAGELSLIEVEDAGTGPIHAFAAGDAIDRAAVAVCSSRVYVASIAVGTGGRSKITLARSWVGSAGVDLVTIRRGMSAGPAVDIACGAGRAWVAWIEDAGAGFHAFLRTVRLSGLVRDAVRDLGPANPWTISVAATDGRAIVAWAESGGGGLRVKRFDVGQGPGFALTPRATRSMMAGARLPVIAIDGQRVALGYTLRSDAWVRTSTDAGASFSGARKLAENGVDEVGQKLIAFVRSIAVAGRRVVATLGVSWPTAPEYHRARTTDFGSSWDVRVLDADMRLDGFLTTPAGPRIAEARMRYGQLDDLPDWRVTFRRQQ